MSVFTPAETAACCRLIDLAFGEDLGGEAAWRGDLTSLFFIPAGFEGTGRFVARSAGVIAGLPAMELVFGHLAKEFRIERLIEDGASVPAKTPIATVHGPMNLLLAGERTALNFLQHLSGIASLTRRFVDAVAGLPVKILDTRKTLPGWRLLAKYAVRQGGGTNHRMGLHDGVLIKDNHLAFALSRFRQSIPLLLRHARQQPRLDKLGTALPIEIEVQTLEQLDDALAGRPDIILLDNMTPDMMREAVQRRNHVASGIQLEASGGVNLQTVRLIAETGVDRISVGAITHSAPALDIALDYEP
ncbi:MAG: carboxylating nicotinate-nucleotide diphosphorylase [Planctomycetes bacterium]|nr:carboxylating nicotinate-nucleotide diphosphorylase [Planctomycetota bacterium]